MKNHSPSSEPVATRAIKAFTLVELLVVIAIIAILAAILFPVFSRARENARRSSCQSNMKQLGLGFLQYAQDFDEKLPEGEEWCCAPAPHTRGFAWANRIYPYVKSSQVYVCPSVSVAAPAVTYLYNGAITRNIQAVYAGLGWAPNNKLAKFNGVSRTVLLMEQRRGLQGDPSLPRGTGGDPSEYGNGYGYSESRACINCAYSGVLDGVPDSIVAARKDNWPGWPSRDGHHLEGANFLAVDGHVKWLKSSAVSAGDNAASAQSPQVSASDLGTAEGTGVGQHAMTMSVN